MDSRQQKEPLEQRNLPPYCTLFEIYKTILLVFLILFPSLLHQLFSYKQENNPRYSAIDVALYRAKRYNIPVVMGSATPSIESYTKALMNNYNSLHQWCKDNWND